MTFFLLTEEKEEAVLDWEDISEEEQRIWRDDGEDDLDLSEDSEEEEEEEEGEKEEIHCEAPQQLTSQVVIYKITKTNCDKKQIENNQQTVKSFWY